MESDGVGKQRSIGKAQGLPAFSWVSSSPAPAAVARLEKAFPEVVCLPVEELEAEHMEWKDRTLIVRSFQRWVPAEAFLREFRRAGIKGEVKPISLSFRCHIIRFEDPNAAESVMSRPWIINGQIIAMEWWKPEFVPSMEAIPFALVWMRLPNLPLELWKEGFLRTISESAGTFHSADASTLEKNRGGFARICVRVDLRRPLRPGIRVQGVKTPFWQQFSYEFLEGFCLHCGSLHLEGPCLAAADSSEQAASQSPVFGSWLAAVRQRRSDPSSVRELRKPDSAKGEVPADIGGSGLQRTREKIRQKTVDEEGWTVPARVARRIPPSSAKLSDMGVFRFGCGGDKGKKVVSQVSVPAVDNSEGTVDSVSFSESRELIVAERTKLSKVQPKSNPFSNPGLGLSLGSLQGRGDGCPGPLKRARPVVDPAPRVSGKVGKKKGKGKGPNSISSEGLVLPLVKVPVIQLEDMEVGRPNLGKLTGIGVEDSAVDPMGCPPVSCSLAQSSRPTVLVGGSEEVQTNSLLMIEGGNTDVGCLPDVVMDEDQVGVPDSYSVE